MDALLQQLEKICHIENTQQALEAYQQLERVLVQASNDQKAEFYLHYAFFMFRLENYDQCMNFFAQAQEYGFPKEEIRQIVYEAFIEPNLEECKENYETTIEQLKDNIYIDEDVSFEDLDLWFIPTLTTKKYFYNRLEEKIISIDVDDKRAVELPRKTNPFGDYLFANDGNIYEIISYIRRIPNEKKLYVYTEKIKYLFSFFQLPDMSRFLFFMQQTKIFGNQQDVVSYFIGCNAYLPRNFISTSQSFTKKDIEDLIHEIHNQRIHDLTRKRDNILLTIGIPSYNRGHRAYDNVLHHLQTKYDDEIEILVSNNGTINDTQILYEKIANIPDSRLSYVKLETTVEFPINAMVVYERAKGKYVLLTSDEDFVNLETLDKILDILVSNPDLSILKIAGDGQQVTPSLKCTEAGLESLLEHSLTANHIYGNIMNRHIIKKYNATKYVREHIKEILCATYPNTYLELLLCQYGKVLGIPDIVINEGIPEPLSIPHDSVEVKIYDAKNDCMVIPEKKFPTGLGYYQTVDGRLKQHKQILKMYKTLELFQNDFQVMRMMYIKLCGKTFHLVKLSLDLFYRGFYDNEQEMFQDIAKQVYECCKVGLDEVYAMDYANVRRKKFDEETLEKLYLNALKTM